MLNKATVLLCLVIVGIFVQTAYSFNTERYVGMPAYLPNSGTEGSSKVVLVIDSPQDDSFTRSLGWANRYIDQVFGSLAN